ncbi:hypothetical protein BH09GEM1_BH09GEM1_41380 [soil metagenome]
MANSDREWKYWGATDPMWAVSSRPGRQKGMPTAWTSEAFLAEGAEYFSPVLRQWQQYGIGDAMCCVEIGCGSGRLTAQLTKVFSKAVAIDVSEHQLKVARAIVGADADHVAFHLVSGTSIPVQNGSCDAVFSAEVFQHFSSFRMIESYFEHAYRALGPNGSLCVNIPTIAVNRYSPTWYAMRRVRTSIERAIGRRRLMDYRIYSGRRVMDTLEQIGFREVELRVFAVGAHESQHAYFLARR